MPTCLWIFATLFGGQHALPDDAVYALSVLDLPALLVAESKQSCVGMLSLSCRSLKTATCMSVTAASSLLLSEKLPVRASQLLSFLN